MSRSCTSSHPKISVAFFALKNVNAVFAETWDNFQLFIWLIPEVVY
jgi:hypothetical protein